MLQEAEYSTTANAFAKAKSDDGLYVEFSMFPVHNEAKSKDEGRPIFDEKPFVKIMIPGDKDNIVHRQVREADKERWPRQWDAFQRKVEQPLEGTPLTEWPGITRAQCEELAHFGCKTVEQLAQMSDSVAQKFMGIVKLRQSAREYMEASKSAAPFQKLQAENDQLRSEMEALKDQMAEMAKRSNGRKKSAEE